VTRIAEAYFHLKPFEVSDELLQSLGGDLSAIAANAALGLFDATSEIEIRLERGSLKGWASVIGNLAIAAGLAYHGVAEYRDFKEGAREIVADAQRYGGRVIEGMLGEKKVPPKSVYRTERRTKTPGKLLRLLWLDSHRALLSHADIERESRAIEALTARVLEDLPADQQTLVRDLLRSLDAATDDAARGLEPPLSEVPSLRPPDVGSFQPKLFDPTPHTGTSLSTITSLVPFGIAYIVEEHNLYARFKLSEWRAMHPYHLPRP
jgi:hypothetical protein